MVINKGNAREKANKFRKLIQTPVLTDVKVNYDGFDAYDVEPPAIPDVLADRPVIVFGKYRGKPKGRIRLQGVSGEIPYSTEIDLKHLKATTANAALRYLWARHRIAILADYNRLRPSDDRIKEVTNLGLTYNLLTAYTSFVAVDTLKRLKQGQATTVKQPLPLPQGVSDTAVGVVGISGAVGPAPAYKRKQIARSFAAQPKALYLSPPPQSAVDGNKPIRKGSVKKLVKSSHLVDKELRERDKATEPDAIASLEQKSGDTKTAAPGETPAKEESSKPKTTMKPCVKVGSITVTGNISQVDVRKQLEALLDDIGKCYQKTFGISSQWPQTVFATMMIRSEGVVVNFKAADVKTPMKEFGKCMEPLFRKMKLATSDQKGFIKIVVTFVLQK